MIYTSYFGKIKKFSDVYAPISVARWNPKGYKGETFKELAPSDSLLRWWRSSAQNKEAERIYTERYKNEVLSCHAPRDVYQAIFNKANGKIPVLVCFEKDDFCHRHLIAEWFKENGLSCEEMI